MTLKKAWGCVLAFSFLHTALWTTVFTLCNYSVNLDTVESFYWGQEMQLGYYKHPPLFAWYAYLCAIIFGKSIFSANLGAQILISLSFIAVFLLATEVLSPNKALLSVILLDVNINYNMLSHAINANTILVPIWAFASYFYYQSIKENRLIYFILLGFTCALGMLGKYFTIFLIASFGIHAIFYAKLYKNPKVLAAIAVFIMTTLPHVVWMVNNNFVTIHYIAHYRTQEHSELTIIASSIARILPLVIVCAFAFKWKMNNFYKLWQSNNVIYFIAIIHTLTFFAYILISDTEGSDKFTIPSFSFIPMLLILVGMEKKDVGAKFVKLILTISLVLLPISTAIYTIKTKAANRSGRDFKQIADAMSRKWLTNHESLPKYVSGPIRYAGNIAFFMPNSPHVIPAAEVYNALYLNAEDIKNHEVLFIWNKNDRGTSKNFHYKLVSNHFVISERETMTFKNAFNDKDEEIEYVVARYAP